VRIAFIKRRAAAYPVRLICRVLDVSPSGYHAWRSRPESPRAAANRQLLVETRRVEARHQDRYGSPRMYAELRAEGHRCSRGHAERLMRAHGIRALAGRRFRPCTIGSRHLLSVAPNVLQQQFVASAASRVWIADITYIRTGEGWVPIR
jgi:transposase InsO family protein